MIIPIVQRYLVDELVGSGEALLAMNLKSHGTTTTVRYSSDVIHVGTIKQFRRQ
jgi:hypothetical protein